MDWWRLHWQSSSPPSRPSPRLPESRTSVPSTEASSALSSDWPIWASWWDFNSSFFCVCAPSCHCDHGRGRGDGSDTQSVCCIHRKYVKRKHSFSDLNSSGALFFLTNHERSRALFHRRSSLCQDPVKIIFSVSITAACVFSKRVEALKQPPVRIFVWWNMTWRSPRWQKTSERGRQMEEFTVIHFYKTQSPKWTHLGLISANRKLSLCYIQFKIRFPHFLNHHILFF